jgi:hypothetical protein
MDDGFFARWVLGSFAPPLDTVRELRAFLGEPLGRHLLDTVAAILDGD